MVRHSKVPPENGASTHGDVNGYCINETGEHKSSGRHHTVNYRGDTINGATVFSPTKLDAGSDRSGALQAHLSGNIGHSSYRGRTHSRPWSAFSARALVPTRGQSTLPYAPSHLALITTALLLITVAAYAAGLRAELGYVPNASSVQAQQ